MKIDCHPPTELASVARGLLHYFELFDDAVQRPDTTEASSVGGVSVWEEGGFYWRSQSLQRGC